MSTHTYVEGYQAADELWHKMKAIWDDCDDLGIQPPDAVIDYFNDTYPGDAPGRVIFESSDQCVKEFNDDGISGYEIDLSKAPMDSRI